MDVRDTPEQAELRRTARRLAGELGPRSSQIQKDIIATRILGLPTA